MSHFTARTHAWLALAAASVAVLGTACLPWAPRPRDGGQLSAEHVATHGAELRTRVEGREGAPVLVMIHGFGSSLDVWEPVAPALASEYRVLRLDLAGFGRSSRWEGDYSREAHAARALAAMDAAGIDRATLVAHSMGAAVALTMALDAPERVDALVLIAPWLFEDQVPWGLRDARAAGVGELLFGIWFEEHLDLRFAWSFRDSEAVVSEEMLRRARAALRERGSRAAALATVRGLELPALEERLGGVQQPALVLQGDDDLVARPYFARRLASTLSDARLVPLADCGHFPMIEKAPRVAGLMREFVESRRP